jgi:general secretion pathway protein G
MWAKQKQVGFTIVELLIVIVIIGILAAITIVAYNGIQNRANDTSIQSDLANFAKKIELVKADTGAYPATLTSAMGFGFSKGIYGQDFQNRNIRYCYNSSTDSYILMANSKSGNYFKVQNSIVSATASTYGWGVCAHIGLASTNPSQDGYFSTRTPQWDAWTN